MVMLAPGTVISAPFLFLLNLMLLPFITFVEVEYSESYATHFVREGTSVGPQNEEEGHVDLPSYFSKRKLNERYVFVLLLLNLIFVTCHC
jgi:hypothetical protein